MGQVFRARDLVLQREVAVKQLLPSLTSRADLVRRAEQEARYLARLRHPGITGVYDMLTSPEYGTVIVLELVDGLSLADLLAETPRLDWSLCAHVGIQVCLALEAAHAQSVIHRDIKPGNILLGNDGRVVVTDFGIARLAGAPSVVTTRGSLIGTPAYWPPEQATGGETTQLSDLYSLCCVLFEAACGRPPFVAEPDASPAAVFVMHVVRPVPDPHTYAPGLPDAARSALMRGLAKTPADRFASASDLARALRESTSSQPTKHPELQPDGARNPPRWPPSPPATQIAAGDEPDERPRPGADALPRRSPLLLGPEPRARRELSIPLVPGFRITTGYLAPQDTGLPFLANQPVVEKLVGRLRGSTGGMHLVCGLPGAGKTTVVERALHQLERSEASNAAHVVVRLSLSRPETPGELVGRMIRGLDAALSREPLASLLASDLRKALNFSARRTTQAIVRTSHTSQHGGYDLGINAPIAGARGRLQRARTSAHSTQASFAPYSTSEMEQDLLATLERLDRPDAIVNEARYSWRGAGVERTPARRMRVAVVFVLDEVDKLTQRKAGHKAVKRHFRDLKTLFCSRFLTVIMVAGADALSEGPANRGKPPGIAAAKELSASITYVGCHWDVADLLLEAIEQSNAASPYDRRLLTGFLAFYASGLFRPLLREVADHIVGAGDERKLTIEPDRFARVHVSCFLVETIDAVVSEVQSDPLEQPWERDWRRFCLHSAAVTMLRKGGAAFTRTDLLESRSGGLEPERVEDTERLVRLLLKTGFLKRVDESTSDEPVYRVSLDLRDRLAADHSLVESLSTKF